MTTIHIIHHATSAEFVAHIAALAAQGYKFYPGSVTDDDNIIKRPWVIAHKGADLVYLRFNAMAEGTHYLRRTHAFTAAAELIAVGTGVIPSGVAVCASSAVN